MDHDVTIVKSRYLVIGWVLLIAGWTVALCGAAVIVFGSY